MSYRYTYIAVCNTGEYNGDSEEKVMSLVMCIGHDI